MVLHDNLFCRLKSMTIVVEITALGNVQLPKNASQQRSIIIKTLSQRMLPR